MTDAEYPGRYFGSVLQLGWRECGTLWLSTQWWGFRKAGDLFLNVILGDEAVHRSFRRVESVDGLSRQTWFFKCPDISRLEYQCS